MGHPLSKKWRSTRPRSLVTDFWGAVLRAHEGKRPKPPRWSEKVLQTPTTRRWVEQAVEETPTTHVWTALSLEETPTTRRWFGKTPGHCANHGSVVWNSRSGWLNHKRVSGHSLPRCANHRSVVWNSRSGWLNHTRVGGLFNARGAVHAFQPFSKRRGERQRAGGRRTMR